MVQESSGRRRWVPLVGVVGLAVGLGLAGCEREPSTSTSVEAKSEPAAAAAGNVTNPTPVALEPRLRQSFTEATRQDPPTDWQRPPDKTFAGKSVGKLYTDVVKLWDTIQFVTSDGKRINYSATIDTELGPIELALRPDLAPNHVRNFVALAQVGYYDGLVFERTVHVKPDDQPGVEVEVLEGGCPLGTGDIGQGSIGYWLKPEFSAEAHEIGTVGACHGAESDTAACRFYVTLCKAPFLDGNFTAFGKVTQGLDTARRIFSLPVRNDPEYPEGDRPEKPVVIRKVTIHTEEKSQ
jgi:peptidyl-prolyl cis-trans isomerase B (cyclophilin B)